MKEIFEIPEVDVVIFQTEDVITTSYIDDTTPIFDADY